MAKHSVIKTKRIISTPSKRKKRRFLDRPIVQRPAAKVIQMPKTSRMAQAFVSRKISKNVEEGRPRAQAIAIALSQARKEGFSVPKKKESQ